MKSEYYYPRYNPFPFTILSVIMRQINATIRIFSEDRAGPKIH